MPAFLVEMISQVKAIWARLDAGQRATIVVVLLATLAGLGGIVWFAGRPDYQEVFSSDDQKLVSEARNALTAAAIPFKPDGASLLVDRAQYAAARSALAEAGVSSMRDPESQDAIGSLIMDSAAKADQLLAKNCRRAEYNVRQITGVLDVRVVANKPRRALFAEFDKETQPRANAVVTLRRGEAFHRTAVATTESVAAALGIPPDNVTVTNARTQEIYRTNPESGGNVDMGEFLAQQEKRSLELTERAQRLLDRAYPDQAQVTVTVQLDPSWEITHTKIVPETPVVRTDRTVKTDTKDGSLQPSGDPSTTAATNGGATAAPGTSGNTSKNETHDRTYEPFTGEKSKGLLAPDIRMLSVGLLIDDAVQLDAAKLKDLGNLVKSAVGWDAKRGDPEIAVLREKFKAPPELEAAAAPRVWALLAEYGPLAGQVLGVLVVVLFLRGLLRKGSGAPRAPKARAKGAAPPPPKAAPVEEILSPEDAFKRMRREIENAISDDPAAISRLLESWLAEQKT